MLPFDIFAEVVGFLRHYDLDALLLTDRSRTELAQSAAARIHVFDFGEYMFYFDETSLRVINVAADGGIMSFANHTPLVFNSETELMEFIPVALRNCTLRSVDLAVGFRRRRMRSIIEAMKEVSHTIVITGGLRFGAGDFPDVSDLADFVGSFRRVRVCGSFFN